MANPIPSRPEDFLATPAQREVCEDIITRSFQCRWDDLADTDTEKHHANTNVNANAASGVGQAQPGTPAPIIGGSTTGLGGQSAYTLCPGTAYAVPTQPQAQAQLHSRVQVQGSAQAQAQAHAQNAMSIDDMTWLNQHQI
ncbi:hypothetical protein LTR84_004564 [Exophiala bonariae]|uniref:Uncharacterized protein n=1 Tax=Exophiala bonariae TaxID=1690606 RepID=A0AAV9NNW1_9EURO|nr:hypothetical protein LTR84_004564 [Exophiala bonariae]